MAVSGENTFSQMTQRFGLLSPKTEGLNGIKMVTDDSTQTLALSALDEVRREAEFMAHDLLTNYGISQSKRPPNRHCKTLRRTVKELSARHDMVFKGMVSRLKPDENSAFQTFVIVADEIFDDGQVNWGRIVAVYAFAARLAEYQLLNHSNIARNGDETKSKSPDSSPDSKEVPYTEKIALFVGKYVANKLGNWILDHGGWDEFVTYFPDQGELEEKIWKGVLFTAIGLGALATMVASR